MISEMRLLEENEHFRLFWKPALIHSVSLDGGGRSCVQEYEAAYPDDAALFRSGGSGAVSGIGAGGVGSIRSAGFGHRAMSEAGLLYRLDYPTSGLLVFARTPEVLSELRATEMVKTYEAGCSFTGRIPAGLFLFDEYMALSRRLAESGKLVFRSFFRSFNGTQVRPVLEGEAAHYKDKKISGPLRETDIRRIGDELLARTAGFVEGERLRFQVRISKGFRHQIRSVLSSLACPIDGDVAYGGMQPAGADSEFAGISLVCRGLEFQLKGKPYKLGTADEI